jgi:hypothetical protein
MKQSPKNFPPNWDESRVRDLIKHYESQSEDEAVAEDEAAFDPTSGTTMNVPTELVPVVRELINKHRKSA